VPPSPPLNIQQLLSSTESVSLQQKVDGIISYATNQSFNSYNNNINSNRNKLNYKSNINTLNLTTSTTTNKSNKSVNNPNIYDKNDNLLILNSANSNYSNETSTNQSDNLSNQSNSKLKKLISNADDGDDETRTPTTASGNKNNANKFDKFYKIPIKYVNKSWSNKRNLEKKSIIVNANPDEWECPNITNNRNLECACDLIYTLRCGSGDVHGLEVCNLYDYFLCSYKNWLPSFKMFRVSASKLFLGFSTNLYTLRTENHQSLENLKNKLCDLKFEVYNDIKSALYTHELKALTNIIS
jgi:hypothetical protein